MSGRYRPIGCCDRECALVNHCHEGGYQCADCGRWFCSGELDDDDLCDECAEERRKYLPDDEEDEEDLPDAAVAAG